MSTDAATWETVRVELEDGIAWVSLHRPEKRNAMNPKLNAEMIDVLETLLADDRCGVLVLTGSGEAFSAGMDLKEYFREIDGGPESVQIRVRRDAAQWQWRMLRTYPKPTMASGSAKPRAPPVPKCPKLRGLGPSLRRSLVGARPAPNATASPRTAQ